MTSIRTRLLVSLLATLALGALVVAAAAYRNVLQQTESLFDYQLRQMALSLRDQGAIDVAQGPRLNDEGFDFVVQIWTADGRAIYASRPYSRLPSRAVLGFADIAVGSELWRTYSVATEDRVIQVAQPLRIRQSVAAQAALKSVLPLLVVAPLLAALMGWLVTRALRPLRRVARDVSVRDAEALTALPAAGLPDEVAPLVRSLNALLERLQAAFGAQRAFVADAAHELRSPLTALKLQVGVLQRSTDEAARRAAVEALAAGVDRAVRLVEQLLTLARNEPGAPASFERLAFDELVRQAVADTVPAAAARGSHLELDAEEGVAVQGDRAALASLVRNLADNAVRYSPAGSTVKLRLRRDGDTARLDVDDAGPGIPAADRERV
ncbi:MAG TPA: histidine kinase dimerization/phospho-acceptor domain-containing protein, partial [Ideonella sp.]|nr:histidine kinase dimerization/phospho-acceptor domain-containing protein [Ideonella sp.]